MFFVFAPMILPPTQLISPHVRILDFTLVPRHHLPTSFPDFSLTDVPVYLAFSHSHLYNNTFMMSVALASFLSFSAREVIVIIMRLMLLGRHITFWSRRRPTPCSALHSWSRPSPPLALSQNDLELPFSVYLKIVFHIPPASPPEMEGRSRYLFRKK